VVDLVGGVGEERRERDVVGGAARAGDAEPEEAGEGEAVDGVAAGEGGGEGRPGHEAREVVTAQVERAPQGRVGGGAAPAPAHERGGRRQVLEVEAREHVHQAVRLHVRPRRRRAGALGGRRRRLHGLWLLARAVQVEEAPD